MLTHEEHEAILSEFNQDDLTHERKAELLTQLREEHTSDLDDLNAEKEEHTRLEKENADLLKANNVYWRQLSEQQKRKDLGGGSGGHDDDDDEPKTKTIDQLLKGLKI